MVKEKDEVNQDGVNEIFIVVSKMCKERIREKTKRSLSMLASTKQNKIKLTRKIKEKEPQERFVNVVYYKTK